LEIEPPPRLRAKVVPMRNLHDCAGTFFDILILEAPAYRLATGFVPLRPAWSRLVPEIFFSPHLFL